MVMTELKVYTVEDVAELLKVNPRTVYKMVQEGAIRSIRAGRQIRITQEALDAYLRGETGSDPTAEIRADMAERRTALEEQRRETNGAQE